MRSQAETSQKQFKFKSDPGETKKALVTCSPLRVNHLLHCVWPHLISWCFFLTFSCGKDFATQVEDTTGSSGPKWLLEIAARIVCASFFSLPVENNYWPWKWISVVLTCIFVGWTDPELISENDKINKEVWVFSHFP